MKYSIATLRMINGKMKQDELAARLGITAPQLSAIENIDTKLLDKIAKELHCSRDDILLVNE